MGIRLLAVVGIAAAATTAVVAGTPGPISAGALLRVLFVGCWLLAAALVAWRSDSGRVESAVTVVFLISFPVAFSGTSAGIPVLDQWWHAAGSISLIAFLYLFPRGQFEPRWTGLTAAASAAYLGVRAFAAGVAAWPGDLVIFPLVVIFPLGLQVVRFRSASNAADRRRLHIVALTSGAALIGQLIVFALQSAGWLGPAASAERVVEPLSYALALLLPLGVTLALIPLDGRVRRLVDRLTLPTDDAAELIARLNALAQASTSGRDLVPVASEAIRRSLRLQAVSIDLDGSSGDARPQLPPATDNSWLLSYQGVPLGRLLVTPRPGTRLSAGDEQILQRLSVQLAPLVGAIHLADQLHDARTELFNVREEERRRLRADLHDELGATLAGLTLKSGLAASLVDQNPRAVRRLLGEIETTLQTSVGRVRELVEGLRPAQLDELGLDAAIREQADRLTAAGSPLDLRVQGHADPGLPAAVELAAYRIAQEALTNAVRHSGGSRVDVDVNVEELEHRLTVRVWDDGTGLRNDQPLGFGLRSMRQRAQEVGGECTFTTVDAGGLVVTARLPLAEGVGDDRAG